ncbi:hypothetical protein SBI_01146 [Streptomyces bingchenggensis BCW-1]|uniref:Uncharacterized protein n=1 Tax=Streptomyces bingchenggensis (strain BCW-1) TaxID=749414 RepID=D7C9T9_STRBB|nr:MULTISPECIES: hypothetical protein [Streptomyces]ADI04267.1 hypothetical protein SBI_01146 [Streptomyces bingchenggensis BCW-1]
MTSIDRTAYPRFVPGVLPRLDQVPGSAPAHLRGVLGLAEDVPCVVDADRTGKRHGGPVDDLAGLAGSYSE